MGIKHLDVSIRRGMDGSAMDEQENPPAKPAIPMPDLPPPAMPSPVDRGNETQAAGPPPAPQGIAVRTLTKQDPEEGEAEAGSIAPFNTRILAALIDVVVAFGLQLALNMVLPHFAAKIAWLVGLAYLVTRDSLPLLGGQSVGKKAMKLKVVAANGQSLVGNWECALIRNGVLAIPFFPIIECFVLLTREGKPEQGRRLGDEWAKTRVINAPEPPQAG